MTVKAQLRRAQKRGDCADLMRIRDNTFIYRP